MNQVIINGEVCKECGYCMHFCPRGTVLEKSKQVNKKGYRFTVVRDLSDCIACGICAAVCPDIAITVKKDA